MPTRYCKDCSLKLGFFKKKFMCQLCSHHFCDQCFSKVKSNAEELVEKLKFINDPSCLKCIVFHNKIKREHLFLLQNKQLTEFLNAKNISIINCTEKYHLVDLIMDFANTNGIQTGRDMETELIHRDHVEELREAARLLQLEEERSRTENCDHRNDDGNKHEPEYSNTQHNSEFNSQIVLESESTMHSDTQQNNESNVDINNSEETQTQATNSSDTVIDGPSNFDKAEAPNDNTRNINNQSQSPSKSCRSPSRHQASGQWCSVDDIKKEEEIGALSVLELKQVLTANFVDFRGCVEKSELIEKVKMLYQSEKKAREDIVDDENSTSYDKEICKICMDHVIDCVLLDCGHLVACTKCGKRLNQCPICRCLVARVVHVFRV